MRDNKKILIIGLCAFATVFGLYMQFFHKDKETYQDDKKEAVSAEKGTIESVSSQDFPIMEEQLEAQTYGDGEINVYFTDMEEIQEDDTFLPYMAYSDMVPATVDFLTSQTQLEIPEREYLELCLSPGMTYKSNNLISFHCYFADLDTDLEIEYVYDDSTMKYTDIHFVKKGEWNLKWKK